MIRRYSTGTEELNPCMVLEVIKLGGSLLTRPNLREHFAAWLERQPSAPRVLVVGGGELVEAIRQADRVHRLDQASAHWWCIEALSLTARLASQVLDDLAVVAEWSELPAAAEAHRPWPVIFDVLGFLRTIEPALPGTRLGHGWHVTSDSIAARIAEVLSAERLILLKSAFPPPGDFTAWAAAGYVDPSFPQAAASLATVSAVHLLEKTQPTGTIGAHGSP